jgi:GNAT superfamily N-acetyltransferase
MRETVTVGMMSEKALLWRCLHGGPLTAGSIDAVDASGEVPWAQFRDRNLAFLRNLAATYGASAVVARSGDSIIGHLRFYPKAVRDLAAQGLGLCLQQEYPYGPSADFGRRAFPPLAEIADKTLLVHCMMLAPDVPGGASFRRKGVGTRMAGTLIDWARRNGWQAIEATAYEALPVIYATSGQADRRFWEAIGFRLVRTEREPALEAESEFVRTMHEEALAQGLDPGTIANKYVMRRFLG